MLSDHPLELLSATESVCPVCLRRIPALREQQDGAVYLVKQCPEHGTFRTKIWRGTVPFSSWIRPKKPATPARAFTSLDRGCPFDCGLCPNHGQHTCTALIEITHRCNLHCPVCFADAGNSCTTDLSLDQIGVLYDRILAASGICNIQLSGGEPSLHADLPAIITLGRSKGFEFIQLNTNGLRLAESAEFVQSLTQAGLASVFLQFDGISSQTHLTLRGRDLRQAKQQAIDNCAAAGLAVVLVPTLVPEVNTAEIGAIINYAVRHAPTVRGVHFQPVSYFGRFPQAPQDTDRLTLPELLQLIETQTKGAVLGEHFVPPGCEHALCSFHGTFLVTEQGRLQPLGHQQNACCTTGESPVIPTAQEGREKSIGFTARQWSLPMAAAQPCECNATPSDEPQDDLDRFLARARTHTFSLTAMAFQDAWNLDLERLRGCCIHVVTPAGQMIPFCAYNLTAQDGTPLHRKGTPP